MEPCHSKLGQLIEMEKMQEKLRNSVQRIKPVILDLDNPETIKEIKKQFAATQKYLKKQINKAMFTRWERFKLWIWRIKI